MKVWVITYKCGKQLELIKTYACRLSTSSMYLKTPWQILCDIPDLVTRLAYISILDNYLGT